MESIDALKKIGLTDKEASVYLALLELGTASVMSIASKAGLKRPGTYLILDDLANRGLVSKVPHNKKALYVAESPDKLFSDLHKKQELLKRFLPNLEALHNQKKEKPQVQLFSGKEGILEVYGKIFSAGEVNFFGTIGVVDKVVPGVTAEVASRAKSGQLIVKDLLSGDNKDLKYATNLNDANHYEARLVIPGQKFPTDNAIFGNSIAFFSFNIELFAVVITSREIVESMKSLFNMAWEVGVPITK